ncbi:MAG: phosphopantetheine-binding protein [Spirochaetes bacterium]|nr:phosphopantetheine-binding protein [Spirochaetota bacterium]
MVAEHILDLIRTEFDCPDATETSDIKYNLRLDEADLMELVWAIEEDFDIEIPDDIWESWQTVDDIIKTVTELEGEGEKRI